MNQESYHGSTPIVTAEQWRNIRWVLLDMDGTLLDLCFDNTFWQQRLPQAYAEHHDITLLHAETVIKDIAAEKYGTLDWYCLDFWSSRIGFDIRPIKTELKHLIGFRAGALAFLKWLKHHQKHIILATNAHPDSIALKDAQTDLSAWVDRILHAHEPAAPKEDPAYWQWLRQQTGLVGKQALFIDDNDHILDAAQLAGIQYCLGVHTPNSQTAAKKSRYPAFDHFQELYPASI